MVTIYTTLPHKLINNKLISLIQKFLAREKVTFLACNSNNDFFLLTVLLNVILCGPVTKFVEYSLFFETTFMSGLLIPYSNRSK
jgi:hypothetical protein